MNFGCSPLPNRHSVGATGPRRPRAVATVGTGGRPRRVRPPAARPPPPRRSGAPPSPRVGRCGWRQRHNRLLAASPPAASSRAARRRQTRRRPRCTRRAGGAAGTAGGGLLGRRDVFPAVWGLTVRTASRLGRPARARRAARVDAAGARPRPHTTRVPRRAGFPRCEALTGGC